MTIFIYIYIILGFLYSVLGFRAHSKGKVSAGWFVASGFMFGAAAQNILNSLS